VKYQNALAKQLAESKYSGTIISEQQKEISVSKISEFFNLTPPEAEDVAYYIKSMGEAIVTYRGANIFLNGFVIGIKVGEPSARPKCGYFFVRFMRCEISNPAQPYHQKSLADQSIPRHLNLPRWFSLHESSCVSSPNYYLAMATA